GSRDPDAPGTAERPHGAEQALTTAALITKPHVVLVTGAGGQIGSRLPSLLRAAGHRVLAVDIHTNALENVEPCDIRRDDHTARRNAPRSWRVRASPSPRGSASWPCGWRASSAPVRSIRHRVGARRSLKP